MEDVAEKIHETTLPLLRASVSAAQAVLAASVTSAAVVIGTLRLNRLLSAPVDYATVFDTFCAHDLISGMKSNILQYHRPASELRFKAVLGIAIASHEGNDILVEEYDHRYFYVDRESKRMCCISGLVRQLAAEILDQLQCTSTLLSRPGFVASVRGESNPSVKGFLAERACIEGVLRGGLTLQLHRNAAVSHQILHVIPSRVVTFISGRENESLVEDTFCVLYVPRAFNYKYVDAILRIRPAQFKSKLPQAKHRTKEESEMAVAFAVTSKDVLLVGIQVSIGANAIATHPHSVAGFADSEPHWMPADVMGRRAAFAAGAPGASLPGVALSFCWMIPASQTGGVPHAVAATPGANRSLRAHARKGHLGKSVAIPAYEEIRVTCETITGEPHLLV
jgi:hypothetical protein